MTSGFEQMVRQDATRFAIRRCARERWGSRDGRRVPPFPFAASVARRRCRSTAGRRAAAPPPRRAPPAPAARRREGPDARAPAAPARRGRCAAARPSPTAPRAPPATSGSASSCPSSGAELVRQHRDQRAPPRARAGAPSSPSSLTIVPRMTRAASRFCIGPGRLEKRDHAGADREVGEVAELLDARERIDPRVMREDTAAPPSARRDPDRAAALRRCGQHRRDRRRRSGSPAPFARTSRRRMRAAGCAAPDAAPGGAARRTSSARRGSHRDRRRVSLPASNPRRRPIEHARAARARRRADADGCCRGSPPRSRGAAPRAIAIQPRDQHQVDRGDAAQPEARRPAA